MVVSGMAFEAKIAAGPGVRCIFGLDSAKLIEDMQRVEGVTGILSFGTAAGLSPSLGAGAIVIASEVRHSQRIFPTDEAWTQELVRVLPNATLAPIAGVDRPLASAREKTQLHSDTGALAADMESHHVAQYAEQHGLPFAVLRVVLDEAHISLPPAALAATKPDGTINYLGLLSSLLMQPSQLGALTRLASAQREAKQSLLRCGLLKGTLFGMR
jgi:hopanoid-associated phosphorylase